MFNRKTSVAIAIAAALYTGPALATGDAGVHFSQRLVREAKTFGVAEPAGKAAGEERARREQRRERDQRRASESERRWEKMIRRRSQGP